MKQTKLVVLMLVLVAVLSVAIGCGPNRDSGSGLPDDSTVTLNVEQTASLGVYDTMTIPVTYNGTETLEYLCDSPEVLTISNGRMTGKSVGTAKVTVTAGDLSGVCTVTVNPINLEKLEFSGSVIGTLYVGDTTKLDLVPVYNGINIAKPAYTYFSADESIATVSADGTIIAKAIGFTMINATCSLGGRETGCSVSVYVAPNGSVSFNHDLIEIYVVSDGEYKNTFELSVTAYEKGVPNPDAKLEFSVADSLVCNLKDGIVTAVRPGLTEITVSYLSSDGITVTDTISVKVSKITKEINDKTYDVSADKVFTINPKQMLGVNSISLTGAKLLQESGLTTELKTVLRSIYFDNAKVYGEQKVILETNTVDYIIPIRLWTAYISDASGLEQLKTATNGHYRLETDISLLNTNWSYSDDEQSVFSGLLDGNGKTIRDLSISGSYGLFDVIGGATIKNVNFELVEINKGTNNAGVIAGEASVGDNVIENVSVSVKINGAYNGSLIGNVSGKLSVKDLTVYAYSTEDKQTVGALFGRVNAEVTAEQVKIYSSCEPSGVNSDDANENSQCGQVNVNLKASVIAPEKLNDGVEMFKFLDGYYVDTTVNGEALVMTNHVEKERISNGKLVVSKNDVDGLANKSIEILVNFGKDNVKYISIDLLPIYHIYKDNIEDLKDVSNGEVYLKEDIDMSDVTWNAYPEENAMCNRFSGVFDGEGHTISNFTTNVTSQKGGLFYIVTGTIKNVSVVNATVQGRINGVFGRGLQDGAIIENVYVHAKNVEFNAGALAGVVEKDGDTVSLKNVAVVIDSAGIGSNNGIISGQYGGKIAIDNCHFLAPSQLPLFNAGATGEEGGKIEGTNYVRENDIVSMVERANSSSNTMTDFVKKSLLDNQYVEINSENITKLRELTGGYVVLTEDVDMKDIAWGEDTFLNTFNGIFDGKGHTISNFTTNGTSQKGGLFYKIEGTIKNLAITNATVVGTINGVFGRGLQNGGVIENVYVHAKSIASGSGAIVGVVEKDGAVSSLKNVTVVIDSIVKNSYNNIICGQYGGKIAIDNCYFVAPSTVEIFTAGSLGGEWGIIEGTNYYRAKDISELVEIAKGSKNTMTEFVTDALIDNQCYEINAENIKLLQELTGGYVVLTGDVDMSKVAWSNHTTDYKTHAFSGTFNGNGYTISNYTVSTSGNFNRGLFHNVKNATIKNLVITNVVGWSNDGIITSRATDSTFENVYVQITKARCTSFGGIVGAASGTNTFKDVYVQLDATTYQTAAGAPYTVGANAGMITGVQSGTIVVDNVVIVNNLGMDIDGANATAIYGADGKTKAVNGKDFIIKDDAIEMAVAIKGNKITVTDLIKNTFNKLNANLSYVEINKDTILNLATYTNEYLILTDNIDMNGVAWAGHPTNNADCKTFTGTFNGNGYTISNFTTTSASQKGGLFYKIEGTIKNLAITNATVLGSINGVLGRGLQNGGTVENVYIHAKSVSSNSGALFGVVEKDGAIASLKNVTVVIDSIVKNSYNNVICGQYGGKIALDNCYFVAPSTVEIFTAGSLGGEWGIIEGTNYYRAKDISELVNVANGTSNTMTDFVKQSLLANQSN